MRVVEKVGALFHTGISQRYIHIIPVINPSYIPTRITGNPLAGAGAKQNILCLTVSIIITGNRYIALIPEIYPRDVLHTPYPLASTLLIDGYIILPVPVEIGTGNHGYYSDK